MQSVQKTVLPAKNGRKCVYFQKAGSSKVGGPIKAFLPWCLSTPGVPAAASPSPGYGFAKLGKQALPRLGDHRDHHPPKASWVLEEPFPLLQKLHPHGFQEPTVPWNGWHEGRLANRDIRWCHMSREKGGSTFTSALRRSLKTDFRGAWYETEVVGTPVQPSFSKGHTTRGHGQEWEEERREGEEEGAEEGGRKGANQPASVLLKTPRSSLQRNSAVLWALEAFVITRTRDWVPDLP